MKTDALTKTDAPIADARQKTARPHAPYQWDIPLALRPPMAPADRLWLLALMALYAVLYLVFYPPIYTSVDEASTFRMAFLLRHGSLVPHDPDFFPSISPLGLHGRTYRFPIGFPALLAPLAGGGGRAFFLLNPALHLAATWFFAKTLQALRMPPRYAALYLLYPSAVLFTRTLLSDPFAASLTTIALYCLLRRRTTPWASALLGLALLTRSASVLAAGAVFVALLIGDWRTQDEVPLWRGRAVPFGLGLLPFLAVSGWYNWYTMGNVLKTGYSADQLSLAGLWTAGPLYAESLLLLFPGMLLAPLLYRGRFWRIGLLSTTAVVLLAAAYNESTYGNTPLETLISTPRQVLPVVPFLLLAYCGLLSAWRRKIAWARVPLSLPAAATLLVMAAVLSGLHQRYLHKLDAVRLELRQTLPADGVVYANKDVFKLHQPVWDGRTYREFPFVSDAQARADLAHGPVYVALYVRSRGFRSEDDGNAAIESDLQARFRLAPGPASRTGLLHCRRVVGLRAVGTGAAP